MLQMWIGTVGLAIVILFVVAVALDVAWQALKPYAPNVKRRLADRLLWREPEAPHDVADQLGALCERPIYRGLAPVLTAEQRDAERKRIFQLVHSAKARGPARIAPFSPKDVA